MSAEGTEVVALDYNSGKELPVGFQKLGSTAGLTPVYETARKDLLNSYVAERSDYDTAQYVLMERASYLEARIKQRESLSAYSSEQNYTMANKTLLDTINLLKKLDKEKLDLDKERKDYMVMIAGIVKYAIEELDPTTQKSILFRLNQKFEEVNQT